MRSFFPCVVLAAGAAALTAGGRIAFYGAAALLLLACKFIAAAFNNPPTGGGAGARRVGVVCAVFNEDHAFLRGMLEGLAVQAPAPQVVVVVDDGSHVDPRAVVGEFAGRLPLQFIQFPSNRGKRHALIAGFNAAQQAGVEVVVTVDSDTQIAAGALARLTSRICGDVVAATGLVVAANRRRLLARLLDVRYTSAFALERAAQSTVGSVICCCGAFACYRLDVILPKLDEFARQTFAGRPATFGDDRRLTSYALAAGRVVYCGNALAYTAVPVRMSHWVRQQIRWAKSWIRESYLLFTERRVPGRVLLVAGVEIAAWAGFTVALTFSVWHAAAGGWDAVRQYAPAFLVIAVARSVHYWSCRADLRAGPRAVGIVLAPIYLLLHLAVILPVRMWAAVTIRTAGWGTRQDGVEVTAGGGR